jgi:putative ABC transport system permease protein
MPPFGPYVGLLDTLIMGGLEILLILFATWFAIHGLLKRNARDLLAGESTANAKEHFYEHWAIWKRMSLYSQTVVNNCVNDKRRVAGTLVGVVGCTALIVTAMTLATDVALSLDLHYEEVYSFDSIAYMDEEGDGAVKQAAMALYDHGVMSSPAFMRSVQMTQSDGTRNVTTLVVPTNEESFKKFYNVVSTTGEQVNVENGGLWVSAAYCEHTGAKVGDSIELKEFTGKTHSFRIAGFFDYYLLRAECVLSPYTYREAFGELPESNVLLIDTDGSDKSALRDSLLGVEGFNTLVDDYQRASYNYDELTRILRTVVLVYLLLSGLMAVVVLLNLNIMFVSEKKRELIVLMINGYSVKDAKAYIYRDSIVLTVIGIGLGIMVGSVVGSYTVFSLEPETGYFVKGFSLISAVVGAVGAGVFSMVVLMFALRLIARFELTDINRF